MVKISIKLNSDKIYYFITYSVLILVLLFVLLPLINIVSRSFSSPEAVLTGRVALFPVDFSLDGYISVFKNRHIWLGYFNSIYYTVFATLISLFITLTAGYALSRSDFNGNRLIMGMLIFSLLFKGGLIPTYLLVKDLGMTDTRWALLLPDAVLPFHILVVRTYFKANIPGELLQASQIDGCNDFQFFKMVVLPLSGPIIAVIALWNAVRNWNSFMAALIYIRNQKLFPLQIILRNILLEYQTQDESLLLDIEDEAKREAISQLLRYSLIIVGCLPVILLYPVIQKYFVKGVMIGSIKG